MYLDFFKLREPPFQLTPDSDFLYLSEAHARAKAYMDYSIRNKDGFVVITGEVGAGKTTLIRKLLSEFDEHVVVAKIFQTQLNEVEFLQAVLVEFGLNPFNAGKVQLMDMLRDFLVDSFLKRKQLVLIVDEAQNLSPRVLEEIRMLSGLETEKQKILHVVLVGQPEMNATLDAPEMAQLLQRVRLRFHLTALSESETKDYIQHRLRVAGCNRNLFHRDTVPLIYQYTGGIPRLINTLCDTAMMCAFADDQTEIGHTTVVNAITELQWPLYARRLRSPKSRSAKTIVTTPAAPTAAATSSSVPPKKPATPRPTVAAFDAQEEALVKSLSGLAARMESIERLLTRVVTVLQERRERKLSIRLGRAQLAQVVKQLNHLGLNKEAPRS